MGWEMLSQNCHIPWGDLGLGILTGSATVAQLVAATNRHTQRQTHRPCYICSNGPHLRTVCMWCGLILTVSNLLSVKIVSKRVEASVICCRCTKHAEWKTHNYHVTSHVHCYKKTVYTQLPHCTLFCALLEGHITCTDCCLLLLLFCMMWFITRSNTYNLICCRDVTELWLSSYGCKCKAIIWQWL